MNNKGFTLVELIVSFVLISVISIFLFQIVSIINNIYNEKGIKTELVLEQSNISNMINKDIYLNDQDGNNIIKILKINDNQVDLLYKNVGIKSIYIDRNKNAITYGNYSQKFLSGTIIGSIDVDFDYMMDSTLKNDGIAVINIPISYNSIDNSYDINILIRFNTDEMVIAR